MGKMIIFTHSILRFPITQQSITFFFVFLKCEEIVFVIDQVLILLISFFFHPPHFV